MADRLRGMLGIAARAGKVASGEFSSERSVRSGKAKLCIISFDASENTVKKFEDMCRMRKVPFARTGFGMTELGHAIGCSDRTSVVIEDEGLATSVSKLIEGGTAHG